MVLWCYAASSSPPPPLLMNIVLTLFPGLAIVHSLQQHTANAMFTLERNYVDEQFCILGALVSCMNSKGLSTAQ